MYSHLNDEGKAAIVCSQGILYRTHEEGKIRKAMIETDIIESIISLPSGLFYGTGIPACILILNKNKEEKRKHKILFIYATKDFEDLKKRDRLRNSDIKKIVIAQNSFKDVEKYCHIAGYDEMKENEFSLNVPSYVDNSEPEMLIDIQETYEELTKLQNLEKEQNKLILIDLKELGIKL
jgi:type I restriction enzyme M protein